MPDTTIHPCWFCGSSKTYIDTKKTKSLGDHESHIAQVRCRVCATRGPRIGFDVKVEPGWPDLDRSNPKSSVSVACADAIERWNKGPIKSI